MERLLIIDPGHGGSNVGATYEHLVEKHVNLFVARHLWKLASKKYHVILTRAIDSDVSISDRCRISTEISIHVPNACFVSLHINSMSGAPEARGHSVFYPALSTKGKVLAQALHDSICASFPALPVYNLGVLPDRFAQEHGFGVFSCNSVPSALSEFLFISNNIDREFLGNPWILERYAGALLNGVDSFFAGDGG